MVLTFWIKDESFNDDQDQDVWIPKMRTPNNHNHTHNANEFETKLRMCFFDAARVPLPHFSPMTCRLFFFKIKTILFCRSRIRLVCL